METNSGGDLTKMGEGEKTRRSAGGQRPSTGEARRKAETGNKSERKTTIKNVGHTTTGRAGRPAPQLDAVSPETTKTKVQIISQIFHLA